MKKVYVTTRTEWRDWLSKYHDKENDGIWVVFYKKSVKKPTLEYEESVEEALCFGWIDSIIKKIDDEKYIRKFTPRKADSHWSVLNKKRVEKAIKEGRMTRFGLDKVKEAKASGMWNKDNRPKIDWSVPEELRAALEKNKKAKVFFEQLAPTYQKQFVGWIQVAKRQETKVKRVKECIALLAHGKKLGLK